MKLNLAYLPHLRQLTVNWRNPNSPSQEEAWRHFEAMGIACQHPGQEFQGVTYPMRKWTLTDTGKALKLRHYADLRATAEKITCP